MKSTQVVAESGYHDTVDVLLVNHVGLPILESFSELGSQVADTQTVLKPAVCRTRKHEVAVPQLLDVPQPLELRCVDDQHGHWRKLHGAVDAENKIPVL